MESKRYIYWEEGDFWMGYFEEYPDYITQALHEYQDGQRQNPIMGGMAKNLSTQDIEGLAAYFTSLPGPLHTPRRNGAY